MPEDAVVAIAPIPLARSRARTLVVPGLLLLLAAGAVAAGLLLVDGWQTIAILALAGLLCLVAIYLFLVVATVRLDVEVSTLRIRWIGVDRRYSLVRGAVTRVPLAGERRARLRQRFGVFGLGLGRARLRGEETIHLVRLARTKSVILVPTDAGRVAIAPRSEEQLIEALSAAARVQQRLDQVVARARAIPVDRVVEEPPATAPARPSAPVPGHVLTGIERTLLEERLAAERAAAIAAAEAERRAAEEAARLAAEQADEEATRLEAIAAPSAERAAAAKGERPRITAGRPGWLRAPRPRISLPAAQPLPRDRAISLLAAATPLAAGMAMWGAASLSGGLDLPDVRLREASVALALAGPFAALGALAVRAWFPRLVGLVTVTSLCALALVGRALFA